MYLIFTADILKIFRFLQNSSGPLLTILFRTNAAIVVKTMVNVSLDLIKENRVKTIQN